MTCVIGFTGAFGSGCTTAAKTARDDRQFTCVLLSQVIRDEWQQRNKGRPPTRSELQRLGDELRETEGSDVLARRAIAKLGDPLPDRIAVDGIRNTAEIGCLKDRFGYSFTVVAILAPGELRWARVQTNYTDAGLSQLDFQKDDLRDRNEDMSFGQQVQFCVAAADVFLDNSAGIMEFRDKVRATVDLITGAEKRAPLADEVLMHMAFSSSHSSQCLKRHVGAVIADSRGQLVSVGYNENPLGTKPCAHETQYDCKCFRDIVRNNHFRTLAASGVKCPVCSAAIPEVEGPPWECPTCKQTCPICEQAVAAPAQGQPARCAACNVVGRKTNLEEYFFPDRAMNWCTAIHAEVWAILAAGEKARGCTLYTTTYPCLQCVEKITQAGIARVIFTEAYTDKFSEERLRLSGVQATRFEGVRSSAFERLFPRPS